MLKRGYDNIGLGSENGAPQDSHPPDCDSDAPQRRGCPSVCNQIESYSGGLLWQCEEVSLQGGKCDYRDSMLSSKKRFRKRAHNSLSPTAAKTSAYESYSHKKAGRPKRGT